MLADSAAAVTALAFASARNDLLAYGGAEGDMWFVGLPPAAPPVTIKVRRGRGLLELRFETTWEIGTVAGSATRRKSCQKAHVRAVVTD